MIRCHAVLVFCLLLLGNVGIALAQPGNKQAGLQASTAKSKEKDADAAPTCTLNDGDYAVFTAVLEGLGNRKIQRKHGVTRRYL